MKDNHWYRVIAEHYGSRKAERSGVPLINHIDEGLKILTHFGCDKYTKDAYCIHPIIQDRVSFEEFLLYNATLTEGKVSVYEAIRVTALAVEYRNVANAYLSDAIKDDPRIKLSSLTEVNQMLVADKVQNFKDFELYHKATHPRSAELERYFRQWLQRLGISDESYQSLKGLIASP